MAVDRSFERLLASRLHGDLDAAAGPHPRWAGSPARLVAEGVAGSASSHRHRPSWTAILLAATLAIALLGAALLVAGGLNRDAKPSPFETPIGVVVPVPSGTPSEIAILPSASPSAQPCLRSWSQAATTTYTTPTGPRMELQAFDMGGGGGFLKPSRRRLAGLYVVLREPVSALPEITIEPVEPPFRSHGKVVTIDGSNFLKVTIRGITRSYMNDADLDIFSPDAPNVISPSRPRTLATVMWPAMEIRQIGDSKGTQTWIVGMHFPVCVTPEILYEFITDEQPPDDNVIYIELKPMQAQP